MRKFIIVFFLLCSQAFALDTIPISLDKAINLAMQSNLDLIAKEQSLKIAETEIRLANKLKNPRFVSNFLVGPVNEENASQFGAYFPIEIAKRGLKKKTAEIDLKIKQNEVEIYKKNLQKRLIENYYQILRAKTIYELKNTYINFLNEIIYNSFETSKKLSLIKERQNIDLKRTEIQLNDSIFDFNRTLNLANDKNLYTAAEKSIFEWDFIKNSFEILNNCKNEKFLDNSIKNENLHYEEQRAKTLYNLAGRRRIPDVEIGAGYAYQYREMHDYHLLPGAFVGTGFEIPIFNFYTDDIKKAKLIYEHTKLSHAAVFNKDNIHIKALYEKVFASQKNLEDYNLLLKKSGDFLIAAKDEFKNGKISKNELVFAEKEYLEIRRDYLLVLDEYLYTYLDFVDNIPE